jgi:hypothetical protein
MRSAIEDRESGVGTAGGDGAGVKGLRRRVRA